MDKEESEMGDIKCTERSVTLCNDFDWDIPNLEFNSCAEAAHFLWNDVKNRSVKFASVEKALHKAYENNKRLYGYIIVKDLGYVRGYNFG